MRLAWDAPSSWPAALSELQPHRCWAGAGEFEACLWDWQMGTVFTPGSLTPRLLFLSQCQLHVKIPTDCITAFWHNASLLPSDLTKDVIPCRATLQKLLQFGHLPKGDELNKSKSGRAGHSSVLDCLFSMPKTLDSISAVQIHLNKSQDTKEYNIEGIWEPSFPHLASTKCPGSEQSTHRAT